MKKKTVGDLLSRFHHMGIIARDADKAAEFFESIGVGPFKQSLLVHYDREVHGKPIDDVKIKCHATTMGPIGFEVIESVAGNSVQKEWLENQGETINHLCFIVDDIDEAIPIMVEAGFKVISSGKNEGGGGMAYFLHEKLNGVQIELDELPSHLEDDFYWGNKPWAKK